MSHLLSTMDRIAEGDAQRREELMSKAGAEAIADVDWNAQLAADEKRMMEGGLPDLSTLPDGAEPLPDVEAAIVNLPEIGTPVRYHARPGFMRARQTVFPATVLSHRDDGTVDLYVTFDSDDTIREEYVRPYSEAEPHHCFALLGKPVSASDNAGEIERLQAEVTLLRAVTLGDYVDPPKSVMDYLADFETRLNAMTSGGNKPKAGKSKKD